MLDFRKVELSDKQKVEEYLRKSNFRGCEYTFGNIILWSEYYGTEISFTDDFCFEKINEENSFRFLYPSGNGDVKKAVKMIIEYSEHNNIHPVICANNGITRQIIELFPNAKIELYRDFCDYVYLADDLENLKGKKYHGKRNHLNRFYENNWSFEQLNSDNIPECIEMNKLWSEENISENSADSVSKLAELDVVQRSLELYDELGYDGGVLRVDGAVQAFTLRKYQGAYTAINREFVKYLCGKYKYINREEDTGAENLRKSKLSYHPVFLEEKYLISFE